MFGQETVPLRNPFLGVDPRSEGVPSPRWQTWDGQQHASLPLAEIHQAALDGRRPRGLVRYRDGRIEDLETGITTVVEYPHEVQVNDLDPFLQSVNCPNCDECSMTFSGPSGALWAFGVHHLNNGIPSGGVITCSACTFEYRIDRTNSGTYFLEPNVQPPEPRVNSVMARHMWQAQRHLNAGAVEPLQDGEIFEYDVRAMEYLVRRPDGEVVRLSREYLENEVRARPAVDRAFALARARDELAENRRHQADCTDRVAAMSDAQLLEYTRNCKANCAPCKYGPGEPVYDATMWHVLIPELLNRLEILRSIREGERTPETRGRRPLNFE